MTMMTTTIITTTPKTKKMVFLTLSAHLESLSGLLYVGIIEAFEDLFNYFLIVRDMYTVFKDGNRKPYLI